VLIPDAAASLIAVIAIACFSLPFIGLLWRAPWSKAWGVLSEESVRTALWLSIRCSLWATAFATFFGVPLAWLLARVGFPGRGIVRALKWRKRFFEQGLPGLAERPRGGRPPIFPP